MIKIQEQTKLAKRPSRRPHDRAVSALGLLAALGPPFLTNRSGRCPKGPERPALSGVQHSNCQLATFGLVAVITVVDLLLVAASLSLMVPGELTGCWRVGMDWGVWVLKQDSIQSGPLRWHPLCSSKLMVPC